MKIIRRAYTYLIALISMEVVIWGVINLLRTIVGHGLVFVGAGTLSMALALVLVGVPVFTSHWLWIQKNEQEFEERNSLLRGFFFYGAFGGLFVPVVQNFLALINRGLLAIFDLAPSFAFVGGTQSSVDNLIAIAVNSVIGAYLFYIFSQRSEPKVREHLTEISRLHGYFWVFYALFFILIGVQQIIYFVLVSENSVVIYKGFSPLVNGLAVVLVGAPLWVAFWAYRQRMDAGEEHPHSAVRLTFLFLFSFLGIIVMLVSASLTAHPLVQTLLQDPRGTKGLIERFATPFSIGLPVAVFWFYFHHWLKHDIAVKYAPPEKRGISRFYAALLALIGLVATLTGLGFFLSVFASYLFGISIFSNAIRDALANSLAIMLTGLPLWLIYWHELDHPQNEYLIENTGSLTRRGYLYIAIFGTVIASMISAINLANELLLGVFGEKEAIFGKTELTGLFLTIEFVIFAIYHWRAIREDNNLLKENEVVLPKVKQGVVLIGYEKSILEEILTLVKARIGDAKVRAVSKDELQNTPIAADEVVLVSLDEVGYTTNKLSPNNQVVIQTTEGFINAEALGSEDVQTVVKAIIAILYGKTLPGKPKSQPWQIAAYIMAVLFLIQLLFGMLIMITSFFVY